MGKPFDTELAKLGETHAWIQETDVAQLSSAFGRTNDLPVLIVAAGGSYTAAEFTRLLFESRGAIAVTHTPQSFLQASSRLHRATVIIFTAGGNNRDITTCFQAAEWREAREIVLICGNEGSKIDNLSQSSPVTTRFFVNSPSGKDGYLATNSLYGFCALTLRAFGHDLPSMDSLRMNIEEFPREIKPYYLALYGDWGRPAAVDLESKMGEAGLAAVTVCDHRHFAHGRHNWIDKRGHETVLVSLESPGSRNLASRTLKLLPASQSVYRISTEIDGPVGGLSLLLGAFNITKIVGQMRGIDPGKPGVPPYGSQIYRMGPIGLSSKPKTKFDALLSSAVARKLSSIDYPITSSFETLLKKECIAYANSLRDGRFGALVVDFDGTVAPPGIGDRPLDTDVAEPLIRLLSNGVPVYFATGRGDSIHAILQKTIPQPLWRQVFISYYNGAFTLNLDQSALYPQGDLSNHFTALEVELSKIGALKSLGTISNKHHQLTIKVSRSAQPSSVLRIVTEFIEREFPGSFRIVHSSHSIDVIPLDRTKSACIVLAESALQTGKSVLAVGDRGAFPGNDYALLSHRFSLSVDQVSSDSKSCWNLLPPGIRGPSGFAYYGRWIKASMGEYKVTIP